MKIRDYTSQILTVFGNMVFTDDNKIAPRTIEANFPKWKQQALLIIYNGSGGIKGVLPPSRGNRFINALNYVESQLDYNANIQDEGASYVNFLVEPSVQITATNNGFVFVGDKLTGTPYTQLKSPNDYGVYKDADLISINDVCFNVAGIAMKIYGNTQVRTVHLTYIPVDVMNVVILNYATNTYALFNPETDDYPISPDVWDIMKALAIAELSPANYRPADYTNDATQPIEKQTHA